MEKLFFSSEGTTIYSTVRLVLLLLSRFICPTLCDPIDGSPPGFPVPDILQARTLEWAAISFSSFISYMTIYMYVDI